MRRILSSFLLVLLGLVLLPASYLHDCVGQHEHDVHGAEGESQEEDCSICEFDLSSFVAIVLDTPDQPISYSRELSSIFNSEAVPNLKFFKEGRAPPIS